MAAMWRGLHGGLSNFRPAFAASFSVDYVSPYRNLAFCRRKGGSPAAVVALQRQEREFFGHGLVLRERRHLAAPCCGLVTVIWGQLTAAAVGRGRRASVAREAANV
jgi:hypothetical protein